MLSSLVRAVALALAIAAAGFTAAAAPAKTPAASPAVPATPAACRWDDPGHTPYMGTLEAAVDSYADMPPAVRSALKQRMRAHQYDEMADIRRDSITGTARYAPQLRDMHFGSNKVCERIDRSGWSADHVERGLVYCEGPHCVIVPTVCRNVSRITRLAPPATVAHGGVALVEPPETLRYEPPTSPGWGNGGSAPLPLPPSVDPGLLPPSWPVLPVLLPAPAGPPLEMPPSPVGTPYVNPFPFVPLFPVVPPVTGPVIPEPGTAALWSVGLLGLAARWAWRRRQAASRLGCAA